VFLHKKYFENVLTNIKLCAKIGIVKVFFIKNGNKFHKNDKTPLNNGAK
jgi:hypothetical protein